MAPPVPMAPAVGHGAHRNSGPAGVTVPVELLAPLLGHGLQTAWRTIRRSRCRIGWRTKSGVTVFEPVLAPATAGHGSQTVLVLEPVCPVAPVPMGQPQPRTTTR